jgi:hypothetical protein
MTETAQVVDFAIERLVHIDQEIDANEAGARCSPPGTGPGDSPTAT